MNEIERQIITQLLNLLIDAGYSLSVWDGESYAIINSRSVDDTLAQMGLTGRDTLQVSKPDASDPYGDDGQDILLIYGNDGHDVIADNTEEIHPRPKFDALRKIMEEIGAFADGLAAEAAP